MYIFSCCAHSFIKKYIISRVSIKAGPQPPQTTTSSEAEDVLLGKGAVVTNESPHDKAIYQAQGGGTFSLPTLPNFDNFLSQQQPQSQLVGSSSVAGVAPAQPPIGHSAAASRKVWVGPVCSSTAGPTFGNVRMNPMEVQRYLQSLMHLQQSSSSLPVQANIPVAKKETAQVKPQPVPPSDNNTADAKPSSSTKNDSTRSHQGSDSIAAARSQVDADNESSTRNSVQGTTVQLQPTAKAKSNSNDSEDDRLLSMRNITHSTTKEGLSPPKERDSGTNIDTLPVNQPSNEELNDPLLLMSKHIHFDSSSCDCLFCAGHK